MEIIIHYTNLKTISIPTQCHLGDQVHIPEQSRHNVTARFNVWHILLDHSQVHTIELILQQAHDAAKYTRSCSMLFGSALIM